MSTLARGRQAAAAFGLRTVGSLQNPAYRTYFLGVLGQFASMSMQMVTGSYLIYQLTDSSALLGTMSLANAIPMVLMSMFGGAIADRLQKKQILFWGLLASAFVALGVAVALATGFLSREHAGSWWILVASSFAMGTAMGFALPARMAIIPEIVNHEKVTNAVALNTLGMNVMSLLAPAAAGFLIDSVGFAAVYFAMAALNFYAATLVFFIPRTSPSGNQTGSILNDIKEGFRYIRRDRQIFFILGFTLLMVVLSMPYQQMLPIYVDNILHVGATGMGILLSVSGAGALVGSLAIAGLPNKKRGLLLLLSGFVSAIGLIVFAFSSVWAISLIFIVFVGLGQTVRGTLGSALLQSYSEPEYMGRVMSIVMMQWGLMSFCAFFAGILAESFPVQWVIGGLAIILLAVTFVSFVMAPRIRALD